MRREGRRGVRCPGVGAAGGASPGKRAGAEASASPGKGAGAEASAGKRARTGARGAALALLLAVVAGCASSGPPSTYTRLEITGSEIRDAGYDTAYQALTNHREILVAEGQIGFRGGDDRNAFGSRARSYFIPLLVVNGDFNMNDTITALRGISADEVVSIRLYYASMVPPRYRRPGAEGGVIEVNTR